MWHFVVRAQIWLSRALGRYLHRWSPANHGFWQHRPPTTTTRRWYEIEVQDLVRSIYDWLRQDYALTDWRQLVDLDVANWSTRRRRAVLLAWFGIVFAGSALVLWSTPLADLKTQDDVLTQLKLRYTQFATQSARLPLYQQALDDFEARFGEQLNGLPATLTPVDVLALLHQAARQSGMQLQAFKPGREVVAATYVVLPAEVHLRGSYHALGRFLESLARRSPLLTVDLLLEPQRDSNRNPGNTPNQNANANMASNNAEDASASNAPPDSTTALLNVTLRLNAYRQRAVDEAPNVEVPAK